MLVFSDLILALAKHLQLSIFQGRFDLDFKLRSPLSQIYLIFPNLLLNTGYLECSQTAK